MEQLAAPASMRIPVGCYPVSLLPAFRVGCVGLLLTQALQGFDGEGFPDGAIVALG